MSFQAAGFERLALLGRGGMGEVFRVRELATGRVLALKLVTGNLAPERAERFRREGELTARLDHPGIVRVIGSGELGGRPYLTYELVEGARSLDAAAAAVSPREGLLLLLEAARALGAAHGAGVVHRDVKPENILVDGAGRVRVADFGLALAGDSERLTKTGGFVGTPSYLAPEQISGGEMTPAVDVWALGVILHEVSSGALPFQGDSILSLMASICRESPAPLADRALDRIARAALSKAPGDRPADGAAFARLLEAYLEGPPPPSASRRLLALALVGALAVSALGAAALLRRQAPPASASPQTPTPRSSRDRPARTPDPGPAAEATPILRLQAGTSLEDGKGLEVQRPHLAAWTSDGLDVSAHDYNAAGLLVPLRYGRPGAFSVRVAWRVFRQGDESSLILALFRTDLPAPLLRVRVVTVPGPRHQVKLIIKQPGQPGFDEEVTLPLWGAEPAEVAFELRFEPPNRLEWTCGGRSVQTRLELAPSDYILDLQPSLGAERARVGTDYAASVRATISLLEVQARPEVLSLYRREDPAARLRQEGCRALRDPAGVLEFLEGFDGAQAGSDVALEALLLRAVLLARGRPLEVEVGALLGSVLRASEEEQAEFSSSFRPFRQGFDNNLWLASDAYALAGARARLVHFEIDPEAWLERSGGREWLLPPLAPERLERIQGDLLALLALRGAGQEVDAIHLGVAWILVGGLERGLALLRPTADEGVPLAALWAGFAAWHTRDFASARRYWAPLGPEVRAAGWGRLRLMSQTLGPK